MPKQYIISEGGTLGIPIEVEKPNRANEVFWDNGYFLYGAYDNAMQAYNQALEEGKKNALPIVGAHPFKDGEVVEESQFEKRYEIIEVGFAQWATQEEYEYWQGRKRIVLIPHTDHRGEESANHLFHALWTKAVGTEGYNKKEWQKLERMLSEAALFLSTPESREESEEVFVWTGASKTPLPPDETPLFIRYTDADGERREAHGYIDTKNGKRRMRWIKTPDFWNDAGYLLEFMQSFEWLTKTRNP